MQSLANVPSWRVEPRQLVVAAGCLAAVMIALWALSIDEPAVALAAALIVPVTAMLYRFHDAAVPLVLFVLYANVAVVAVRHHGIPSIAGKLALGPLMVPLFYYAFVCRKGVVLTATLPWIVCFVLIQLLSALFSQNPNHAVEAVLTSVTEGLILYLVITNVIRSEATVRRAVWALLAAGAFMGGLSLIQQVTGTVDRDYGGFAQVSAGEGFHVEHGLGTVRQRRLAGPIGEQNRYAQIMLMLIPLGVACMSCESSRALKWTAMAATILIALGCGLTFSRGTAVAFVLTLAVAVPLGVVRPRQLATIGLVGLLLILALPQYRTRLATLTSAINIFQTHGHSEAEPDGAIRGRATAMLAAARMWTDHPLLGVGPDLSQSQTRKYGMAGGLRALEGNRKAHCLYLELAAEVGLLGLGCFLMLIATSLRNLFVVGKRFGKQSQGIMATGFLLAIVAYLTTGLFLHFSYVRYFWLILAVADAAAYVALRARGTRQDTSSAPAFT